MCKSGTQIFACRLAGMEKASSIGRKSVVLCRRWSCQAWWMQMVSVMSMLTSEMSVMDSIMTDRKTFKGFPELGRGIAVNPVPFERIW